MIRIHVLVKLLTNILLMAVTAFAQSSDRLPMTDAEKANVAVLIRADCQPLDEA